MVKYLIDSVKYPGSRYADEADIGVLMGRVGHHWPSEGIPRKVLNAEVWKDGKRVSSTVIAVWVKPAGDTDRKSSKHRAMCECPGCSKVLSVGRLHQHGCNGAKVAA